MINAVASIRVPGADARSVRDGRWSAGRGRRLPGRAKVQETVFGVGSGNPRVHWPGRGI